MNPQRKAGIYTLHDYGVEGYSFYNDEPFPSVDEAVRETVKAQYGSPFIVVKLIDWKAEES